MSLYADLHLHTTASDGILSPSEVVHWAKKRNLTAIAITDHDTVSGIEEAINEGEKVEVEVIPGIELNSVHDDEDIHILGYYVNYRDISFTRLLKTIQHERSTRAEKMVKKLNDFGLKIDYKDVLLEAQGESIGRPHVARVLEKLGYTTTLRDAFNLYIGKGCPGYVERYKLTPEEACQHIRAGGGVPVLAHPGLLKNKDIILRLIKNKSIDGIEVFHSLHSKSDSKKYLAMAASHNLIITGGSDCHGKSNTDNLPIIGSCPIPYSNVNKLKELINS